MADRRRDMSEGRSLLDRDNGADGVDHYHYGTPLASPIGADHDHYGDAPPSSPSVLRRRSVAAVAAAEGIVERRVRREESLRGLGVGGGGLALLDGSLGGSGEPPRRGTSDGAAADSPGALPEALRSLEGPRSRGGESADGGGKVIGRHMNVSGHHFDGVEDHGREKGNSISQKAGAMFSRLPAIALASVLNFMVGIPFGASYFPTEFPLAGKEVLGLRMFTFSTVVAQFVFTFESKLVDCTGLQMVENVPFYLELARIVMEEQASRGAGGASDVGGACSTLFFLFGLSSVIVGSVFYLLGRLELGRVVYFFPAHVLMGCIGGIGAFIVVTCLEVSTDTTFSFTAEGFQQCIVQNFHLLAPVIVFELALRFMSRFVKYPLLGPIYFCFITPILYLTLWTLDISMERAEEAGYFFPRLSSSGSALGDPDLFDIFTMVNLGSISWTAVVRACPTVLSLAVFSLFHVPINIPAFAISTHVEPDMNAELIAHGYSNALAGLFGGLQNYLCYSNSVIYSKSNGKGKASSLALVAVTIVIYIYGPMIASFVPRCMAGTLLLHVGIDLFLEGVVETYKDYDKLEYSGIWLITIVMVAFGMDAALVAGAVAALSTYAAQSMIYQDPIRGSMSGVRLRSSAWNRCPESRAILEGKNGRRRIFVVQLQGHIFFGNVTKMADDIKRKLRENFEAGDEPAVVILDFTNSLGLDSSAAQSIAKLKTFLLDNFEVEIILFVTGHEDGFRCTYDLSHKVMDECSSSSIEIKERMPSVRDPTPINEGPPVQERRFSFVARTISTLNESKSTHIAEIPNSRVCETLDEALIFAEDVLIALEDPSILRTDSKECFPYVRTSMQNADKAKSFLEALIPAARESDMDTLYALLSPEKYSCGDILWEQGDASTSLKLVVEGSLVSLLEDERGLAESIYPGSMIGELGLVTSTRRLTTVKVLSQEAILYSLSKDEWESLTQENPKVARHLDMLVIQYLAHRVQQASNITVDRHSVPV